MAELLAAAPCVEVQQASTARFASLQVSHGHKFRAQEWMARRFPEATQCGSGKDVVVFALDDPERVVGEREVRQDAHERAAVALDFCVPAAGVDDVDHVIMEGAVFWLDPFRAQDRDGRAGAEQRQGDLALTAIDGNTQRGEVVLVPR